MKNREINLNKKVAYAKKKTKKSSTQLLEKWLEKFMDEHDDVLKELAKRKLHDLKELPSIVSTSKL